MAVDGEEVDPVASIFNPRLSDVFDLVIRQDEVDFVYLSAGGSPALPRPVPALEVRRARVPGGFTPTCSGSWTRSGTTPSTDGSTRSSHPPVGDQPSPSNWAWVTLPAPSGDPRSARPRSTASSYVPAGSPAPCRRAWTTGVLSLLVPGIAEDRISDLTASRDQGLARGVHRSAPREDGIRRGRRRLQGWDAAALDWRLVDARLPYNPADGSPLLSPLNLLRRLPWINYGDYYRRIRAARAAAGVAVPGRVQARRAHLQPRALRDGPGLCHRTGGPAGACCPRPAVHAAQIATVKRRSQRSSARRPVATRSGQEVEELASTSFRRWLYPELDLAAPQSRTDQRRPHQRRVFHNDGNTSFLNDLRDLHGARQPSSSSRMSHSDTEHVNQLYRYLDDEDMGRSASCRRTRRRATSCATSSTCIRPTPPPSCAWTTLTSNSWSPCSTPAVGPRGHPEEVRRVHPGSRSKERPCPASPSRRRLRSPPPTDEQASTYDQLFPMLEAAHREMTELSKKKQDGIVNALKIKVINRLLGELSQGHRERPEPWFRGHARRGDPATEQRRGLNPQPVAGSAQAIQGPSPWP